MAGVTRVLSYSRIAARDHRVWWKCVVASRSRDQTEILGAGRSAVWVVAFCPEPTIGFEIPMGYGIWQFILLICVVVPLNNQHCVRETSYYEEGVF